MTSPQAMGLTPVEAAAQIRDRLELACDAVQAGDLDNALDAHARALGLALQLGPAATERTLSIILHSAQQLAHQNHVDGLSALGPMIVDLVTQVRQAAALPPTALMEAWATVAVDLGALIGQLGLALSLDQDRREAIMNNARCRAALLDKATGGLFALDGWLDQVCAGT